MAWKNSFKLRSRASLEAGSKQTEEEKTKQHWLSVEGARTKKEAYEIKEISGWMMVGPMLGLLVAVGVGLLIWASGTENAGEGLWWILGIAIAPLLVYGFATDLDDKWKASKEAKEELGRQEPKEDEDGIDIEAGVYGQLLNGHRYKYDHIYTDSLASYWFYFFAKFVMGLSTVVFGIGAAILLFMWLGSISIAPTTIIIILLVLILMKK